MSHSTGINNSSLTVSSNGASITQPSGSISNNSSSNSVGLGTGSSSQSRSGNGGHHPYSPQSHSSQGGETLSKTNLYIRGLTTDTSDKDLVAMCKQ